MLHIYKGQNNYIIFTADELTTIASPKYLFIFTIFLIALFILPVIGFVDGLGYKKNDNEYLDSARWIDGK